jgi:transcriptional regulator with XRE-family HTH domain
MAERKSEQVARGEKLEVARRTASLSQRALARDLGITQGHYSKLVTGRAHDKNRYIDRGLSLIEDDGSDVEGVDQLVKRAAQEIRRSTTFRQLIQAALAHARHRE